MTIVGSALNEHPGETAVYRALANFMDAPKGCLVTPEWSGFNILQRATPRAAPYGVGFVASKKSTTTPPIFIYLFNADEVNPESTPQDAFSVYQGHHGDLGVQFADVCLTAAAYTEKSSTWINTEGGRSLVAPLSHPLVPLEKIGKLSSQ